jgi:D-alanyl-D-alanine carboxypeptidase (penicillin-binding protein 5/6)
LFASQHASDAEGSQAFLDAGSKYSVRDLLKSVIVASANDSAIVLAEGIAGSEANFVTLMNERAKSLGMKNTLYANATGLPAENQYSTARDTSIILDVVSDYEIYLEDCKIWMDELVHPSGRKTELVNTNRLIKYYPNCITGKTGFTDEAGYCLSSTASKNNLNLICVVLGCDSSADRFTESVELYNYTYANFISEKILDKEVMLDKKINIVGGKEKELSLRSENDYYLTRNILDKINYSFEYEIEEKIKAPIKKGEIVGKVLVRNNEDIIASVNVVASDDIEKETYMDIVRGVIGEFGFTTN